MKTDNTTLPLEHLAEYDGAAEWCAAKGLTGALGDPLPENMHNDGALKYIQADPEAFQERVRQCAYARAMRKADIYRLLSTSARLLSTSTERRAEW